MYIYIYTRIYKYMIAYTYIHTKIILYGDTYV